MSDTNTEVLSPFRFSSGKRIETKQNKYIEYCPNEQIKADRKETRVKANRKQTGVKANHKQTGVKANRKQATVKITASSFLCFVLAGFISFFQVSVQASSALK